MAAHHTKDKGDLGTAKAFADLVGRGFTVLSPATEHAPFDLVAYRTGAFHRVQVKFRSARAGTIFLQFRSMWADRNGTHIKRVDKSEIDVVCVYCPDTDECHYLRPADFRQSVTLRVRPAVSAQQRGIHLASDFRQFPWGAPTADTPSRLPHPPAGSREDRSRPGGV